MEATIKISPTVIVIFGAGGDLTWRKLMPAIYNLYLDSWIPEHFAVLGVAHTEISDTDFRKHINEGVDKFSRRGKSKKEEWKVFEKCISYKKGDFGDIATYKTVKKQID